MYLSISTAAVLLGIFVSEVSAHARALNVWGDIGGQQPYAYAITGVPVGGGDIYPHQFDTTVFSSPIIPNYNVPRVWLSQGCGSTLGNLDAWAARTQPGKYNGAPVTSKVWWWYSQYIPNDLTAYTNQIEWTERYAKAKQLPQCSQGGALSWKIYTVNADGAGPFRCRIDETGTGAHFGAWLYIPNENQAPPLDPGRYSFSPDRIYQLSYIKVPIPAGTVCRGSFGGTNNVCIMRCENYALNGPFGGCMAFELRNKDGSEFGVKTTKVVEVTSMIVTKQKTKEITKTVTKTYVAAPSQVTYEPDQYTVPTQTANVGYNLNGGSREYKKRDAPEEHMEEKRETDDYFEKRAFNPYEEIKKRENGEEENVEKRGAEPWEPQVVHKLTKRDKKLFRRAQADKKPTDEEMREANRTDE